MKIEDRFLKYVAFDTQSAEEKTFIPSTEKQTKLAKYLVKELKSLGASHVRLGECSYVYGEIPANTGKKLPVLGFIAHMDTSPEVSGENVKPVIVRNYQGGDILLNKKENIVFSAKEYPEVENHKGEDIIFTDGTTLLGADDKAGVAAIMTMAEYLLSHPEIEHGKIVIGFTPDEEVGHGPDAFDIKHFGADFAYTIDGEAENEIEYENFNAAAALVKVSGYSIHPGSAKDRMKNACLLAMEYHYKLPQEQAPVHTEGYEGFFHLGSLDAELQL